jgi:4-hydroxy-3-methylbut-2-enyl diphosphate reductase
MPSSLNILVCAPRGFCAGVERAIACVEKALALYGPPVFVCHEIVHNTYVVDNLRQKGAIFVDSLSDIPETSAPVIFSAHGVPTDVLKAAQERNLFVIDATCPLVTKVHLEARKYYKEGRHIILVGHEGHPEVIGTMGQIPTHTISLVETRADVAALNLPHDAPLAYVTQTTLSVEDTTETIRALKSRFTNIVGPVKEDICYATTNRQHAVQAAAPLVDALLVVGSPNSSNSQRLKEVAERAGCPLVRLILRTSDIDWDLFGELNSLGITAGASAPEILVEEIIQAFRARYDSINIQEIKTADEKVFFPLPRNLRTACEDSIA